MKINLVTTAQVPGGVIRHILDLGGELSRRGHEVVVTAPGAAAAVREAVTAMSLPFTALEEPALHCDVWHLHLADTFDFHSSRLLVQERLRRRSTVVITEHLPRTNASDRRLQPGPRTFGATIAKTLLKRAQYAAVHKIIAVSEGSRRFLVERYHADPKTITVVPNGIPPLTDPLSSGRADTPFTILAAGTLSYQKGHDVLLGAVSRRNSDYRVLIVGEGGQREWLEKYITHAELPVELLGWRGDVNEVMASADVVCLPSRWEACPYVALEAMRAGRGVIATRVDGLEDLVVEAVTGTLVAPEDSQALATALDELASMPEVARRMGAAGRERMTRSFTLSAMVDATLCVYGKR